MEWMNLAKGQTLKPANSKRTAVNHRSFSIVKRESFAACALSICISTSLYAQTQDSVDQSALTLSSFETDASASPVSPANMSLYDAGEIHAKQSYYQAISSQYYQLEQPIEHSPQHFVSLDYKTAEIHEVSSNYLGLSVSAYQNDWLNVSGGLYMLLNEKEEFLKSEEDYYLPAFAGVNVEHKNKLFKYLGYSVSFMAAGAPKQAIDEASEQALEEQEDKYEVILEPKVGMFFPISNKTELGVSGGYMMMDEDKATTSYGIDFRLHW